MARGRTALTFVEKIDNAQTSEATQAQVDFITWLKGLGVKIDERTVIVAQKLYPEFLKTPEAEAARAERKVEAEAEKAEKISKAQENFLKRAEKLGFKVEKVAVEDAE